MVSKMQEKSLYGKFRNDFEIFPFLCLMLKFHVFRLRVHLPGGLLWGQLRNRPLLWRPLSKWWNLLRVGIKLSLSMPPGFHGTQLPDHSLHAGAL